MSRGDELLPPLRRREVPRHHQRARRRAQSRGAQQVPLRRVVHSPTFITIMYATTAAAATAAAAAAAITGGSLESPRFQSSLTAKTRATACVYSR